MQKISFSWRPEKAIFRISWHFEKEIFRKTKKCLFRGALKKRYFGDKKVDFSWRSEERLIGYRKTCFFVAP